MPVETIDSSSQDEVPVGSDKERENPVQTTVRASTCHALDGDKPKFSRTTKVLVLVAGSFCGLNCSVGTSIPSGAYEAISENFSLTSKMQVALLNSLNMVGFILGPLLFGPLSEFIGRRPVMILSYLGFFVFMLACSGAPNYPALLAFRLLSGINAAAPFSVVGGLYSDIMDDPHKRGQSIAAFMVLNTWGAFAAPLISGFASRLSWRWPFWAASIMAAPGIPLVLMLPETYAPVLRKKTHQLITQGCDSEQAILTQPKPFDARKIFLRPAILIASEPILLMSSIYLALAYSILYLLFQVYPIIFQDMYNLSPSMAGLAYIPLIIGAGLALPVFFLYSSWYHKSRHNGKQWAQSEANRRLPTACAASPCMVIGMFWLGWISRVGNSPIFASVGGVFIGFAFQMIFMITST
ncbi:unnamed protein product [Clonostachys byssicola]|uniref:Major facilitator superfamily (MFS) profile domain-containing protein n=1 Tax=Clonostachys byssicola TaxID=160290 RepID=A0A9N9UG56_9HYPO|nr:unnamed protein product [Clonostachys byssicola]